MRRYKRSKRTRPKISNPLQIFLQRRCCVYCFQYTSAIEYSRCSAEIPQHNLQHSDSRIYSRTNNSDILTPYIVVIHYWDYK